MNISDMLKNPWVWGLGITVGVIVIATTSQGKQVEDTSFNPNTVSSLSGLQMSQNAAGLAFTSNMADLAMQRDATFEASKTTRTLKVIDAIQNMQGIFSTTAANAAETAAGITNAQIQAMTALALDRNLNETRRDMIYVAGDVSKSEAQLSGRVSVTNNLISTAAANSKATLDAAANQSAQLFDFGKVIAGLMV